MKTQAAFLQQPDAPLVLGEVSLTPPGRGEVLVEIVAAGLCHSDLSIMNGTLPHPLPVVLGHEASGVVREVGPGVARQQRLYYAFFDTAINRYLVTEGGLDIVKSSIITYAVETQCRFISPVTFPDALEIGLRVGHLGSSSVRYELAISKEGEPHAAAAGYFVHVFVERAVGRPTDIPAGVREAPEKLQAG